MIGPKLDARTYAILILACIGVLIAGNLIGQSMSTSESQAEVAAATQSVAAATEKVAESNAQIATAISDLADAVRAVNATMMATAAKDGVSVPDNAQEAIDNAAATPAEGGKQKDGVFQLN